MSDAGNGYGRARGGRRGGRYNKREAARGGPDCVIFGATHHQSEAEGSLLLVARTMERNLRLIFDRAPELKLKGEALGRAECASMRGRGSRNLTERNFRGREVAGQR